MAICAGLSGAEGAMPVNVPAKDVATMSESGPSTSLLRQSSGQVRAGKPAAKAEGVKFLRMEANAAVYEAGSGTYRFQSTLPETNKQNVK